MTSLISLHNSVVKCRYIAMHESATNNFELEVWVSGIDDLLPVSGWGLNGRS